MSRKIKFRFWDSKKEEYVNLINEGFEFTQNKEPQILAFGFNERFVVEQYTGLKDKNGKEIYDGDIVRTTDRVTVKDLIFPIGVVEFKQQAFWICNVPSGRPDFMHNETLLQYWETDLEVIGNVHEDPELLEDK